jgi:hypothetical protein
VALAGILRERGLHRRAVEFAVDDLAAAGEVALEATALGLRVAVVSSRARAA